MQSRAARLQEPEPANRTEEKTEPSSLRVRFFETEPIRTGVTLSLGIQYGSETRDQMVAQVCSVSTKSEDLLSRTSQSGVVKFCPSPNSERVDLWNGALPAKQIGFFQIQEPN